MRPWRASCPRTSSPNAGATDRLAQAFQTLVPEIDRQRQLLALAEQEVAASEVGQDENFAELWTSVETMMTSYSDASFVSDEYGRELSTARARAVEVEAISDDPPERIATWVATVSDTRAAQSGSSAARRSARRSSATRRAGATSPTRSSAHADDLVRVGHFDQAWRLADAIATEAQNGAGRGPAAQAALLRFGHGAMMKHVGEAPAQRGRRRVRALQAAVPRDRPVAHRAARRSAVDRTGRAIAPAAARRAGRRSARPAASPCSG